MHDAPALRFQRDFSELNQPLRDVVPPIGSFKRLVIGPFVRQDGRCRRNERRLSQALLHCLFGDSAPDSPVPVFKWADRLETQMVCAPVS